MNHGFQFICLTETKRLVWLLGITFSVVMVFQYFELPYGSVLSSLLPAGKVSFLGKSNSSAGDLSSNSEKRDVNLIADFGLFSNRTSFETSMEESKNSTLEDVKSSASGAPEKARDTEHSISSKKITENNNSSLGNNQTKVSLSSEQNTSTDSGRGPPSIALPPIISSHCIASPTNSDTNSIAPVNKTSEVQIVPVMSISKMNELLLQSHSSPHSVACPPQLSSTVDQELLYAKSQIENAPAVQKNDSGLYAPLYRNVSMFKRSYEMMENALKVYIYKEGEKPIFHESILEGIYSCEGWFLKLLEANKKFVTGDPGEAHLFYLPFSSRLLQLTLYVRNSHSRDNLIQYMKNYTDMLTVKYPFWNRTDGADHFLAACHDWAPAETRGRMLNCIRALCNADIKTGFNIGKDVSIPTTYVRSAQNPLKNIGGESPSHRPILAFFAGYMHGHVRPILLKHWGDDPDMKIFDRMPHVKGNANYIQHMKSSKYCICARGFAVHSPRVVESIFYECVPVIVSDNYVPPLFEVLNWESFAVFVLEKDIPDLKNILLSISEEKYLEMQKRVKEVQKHFLWHAEPVKYDLFHMILHSIWYNRVFRINPT